MCAVAIFSNGNTGCKKKLPVSNGRFTTSFPGKVMQPDEVEANKTVQEER
jgi:hypothetical protein